MSKDTESTDITPDTLIIEIPAIYHMPICDCGIHDINGNPACDIHQGKLQTFYDEVPVIYKDEINHFKYRGKDIPYCDQSILNAIWKTKTGYINCTICIAKELKKRNLALQRLAEFRGESHRFKLNLKKYKITGKVRDVQ